MSSVELFKDLPSKAHRKLTKLLLAQRLTFAIKPGLNMCSFFNIVREFVLESKFLQTWPKSFFVQETKSAKSSNRMGQVKRRACIAHSRLDYSSMVSNGKRHPEDFDFFIIKLVL